MNVSTYTLKQINGWSQQLRPSSQKPRRIAARPFFDLLAPLRRWLNNLEINNPRRAHRLCAAIPAQCPFARDLKFFNRTLVSIPPLCKLNPLYDEVVALRFRALCYLAEACGEDISRYC
ncbi:MAG: hypothetical protein HC890_11210 [Chloroflexaceae bacterium]|nr:hypothetical protein [Chloroflexaceae bacterium]